MKPLTYLSVAELELVEAGEFYDSRGKGLGKAFLDAIHEAAERVRKHPQWWSLVEQPIRSCRVRRFPYRLLYVEEPDRIVIVAVMHASRHPDYWKDRLS